MPGFIAVATASGSFAVAPAVFMASAVAPSSMSMAAAASFGANGNLSDRDFDNDGAIAPPGWNRQDAHDEGTTSPLHDPSCGGIVGRISQNTQLLDDAQPYELRRVGLDPVRQRARTRSGRTTSCSMAVRTGTSSSA